MDKANDETEPVNGESMVKSNGSSRKPKVCVCCCAHFLLFNMERFIRLPPNADAGLGADLNGPVALECNDVNDW